MARSLSERSAEAETIMPLLPPNSSKVRPKRWATRGASALPMRVEPVALTRGTRRSSASASPMSAPPMTTALRLSGTPPAFAAAASSRAWQARAVSGVFSDGFHTSALPQTSASAAFHDHTAAGKLNALMMPTTPSGCQVSIMRWPGRSEAIVSP